MNTTIKHLSEQALVSTKWSVVNDLSTVPVDRDSDIELFSELLLEDFMKLCRENIDSQNRRFAPVLHSFVESLEHRVKERYGNDKL